MSIVLLMSFKSSNKSLVAFYEFNLLVCMYMLMWSTPLGSYNTQSKSALC